MHSLFTFSANSINQFTQYVYQFNFVIKMVGSSEESDGCDDLEYYKLSNQALKNQIKTLEKTLKTQEKERLIGSEIVRLDYLLSKRMNRELKHFWPHKEKFFQYCKILSIG